MTETAAPTSTSDDTDSRFAHWFAQTGPKQPSEARAQDSVTDPDLARVMAAWPRLPDPIKAAILTLVATVTEEKGGQQISGRAGG